MKVHITLVGGQPAPVYHGIVATKPDKVVYVYSKDSQPVLDILKSEIKIDCDDIPPLSPTKPDEIISLAEQLAQKYFDDDVTLNISSGLKSWSHLFGRVFEKYSNTSVVYMDQNNVLWNYRTMTKQEGFVFDMHTLFKLYGNSIENNYKHFDDFTKEDEESIRKIEEIRLHNVLDFNALTTVLTQKQSNILKNQPYGKFDLSHSNSYVEWEKTTNGIDGFVRLCLYSKKGKCKEIVLESANIVDLVFNAGWFEYKVARLLSRCYEMKEICLNCHFPFRPNMDKNEVDIIANTGTKILFVECKTQITHTTDIDKFRSVIVGYGGTGSKGLFVTDAKMSDVARKKCEDYNIIHYSLQDEHEGLTDEEALSALIESELLNINTR